MAWDFGTTDNHTNRMNFGVLTGTDMASKGSFAFWILRHSATSSVRHIIGQKNGAGGSGWACRIATSTSNKLAFYTDNGSAEIALSTVNLPNAWSHWVSTWDGTTHKWYKDGVQDNSQGHTQTAATGTAFTVGSASTTTIGAPVAISDIMVWSDALTPDEAAAVYHGMVPRPDILGFWADCNSDAGYDRITGTVPTKSNTVTLTGSVKDSTLFTQGFQPPKIAAGVAITALTKVIDDAENLVETKVNILGLLKLIAEDESLVDSANTVVGLAKVISDDLELSEAFVHALQIAIHVIDEHVEIVEAVTKLVLETVQVIDSDLSIEETKIGILGIFTVFTETLQVEDGTTDNIFSPAGFLTEVMGTQVIGTIADFDGASSVDRATDWTGLADGKTGVVSMWLQSSSSDTVRAFGNNTNKFIVNLKNDGTLRVKGYNAAGTNILSLVSSGTGNADGTWHHLMASWDLGATTPVGHIYVDGKEDSDGSDILTDDTIDYTTGSWSFGATVGGTAFFLGQVAQLYFDTRYVDLSIKANREAFYDSRLGLPRYLGSHETASGSDDALVHYLGEGLANRGSGGNFSGTTGAPAAWTTDSPFTLVSETVTQTGKTSTTWVKGTLAPNTNWKKVYPPFIKRTQWTND